MAAEFFQVDVRTIERYISAYSDELKSNGYLILRGRDLKEFLRCYDAHFGADIYVGTKTTVLGVFDFRAVLNHRALRFIANIQILGVVNFLHQTL